ncbi:MAG TPA: iron-containing redox enzyme family protein [Gammaproteobacteria bacterium]|nr:iron-containing redox enzyme family protein [Gammaproteobacteria bacterium]
MEAEKFYDDVTQEILNIILDIPLLHEFDKLNINQLQLFFIQFYHLVRTFPQYLGALIWQSPDEAIRLAIVDNLVDECGGIMRIEQGEISDAHPIIYRRVTRALGINDQELASVPPRHYTQRMLDELKKLFIFSPFIQAFGGMAPGIESISSTWIDVIQNGLKKKNILTRDDLLYFELHTVVDMKHSGLFRNAIIPYLNTETSRKLLRDGALIMVNAQKWLFDGIAKDFSSPY